MIGDYFQPSPAEPVQTRRWLMREAAVKEYNRLGLERWLLVRIWVREDCLPAGAPPLIDAMDWQHRAFFAFIYARRLETARSFLDRVRVLRAMAKRRFITKDSKRYL